MANYSGPHSQNDKFPMWYPPPVAAPPRPASVPPCFTVPPPPFGQPPPTSVPPPPPPPPMFPPHAPPFCAFPSFMPPQHQIMAVPNEGKPAEMTQNRNTQQIASSQAEFASSVVTSEADAYTEDEQWLQQFLSKRRQSFQPKTATKRKMKIFEAREILRGCVNILKELKQKYNHLSSQQEALSSPEWKAEFEDINKKKADVTEKLKLLDDPAVQKVLQVSLTKRKKKRKYQKRHRENWRSMKFEKNAERQKLHREIDTWLENMQESVEKAKVEESLKLEADSVLSDVTKKKVEARRQLSLLSALARLRKLRVQAAVARGERVSSELEACFTSVMENLKSLWEEKMEEYALEEKGLRVMLTEAVDERKIRYDRTVLAQWKALLFGRSATEIHPFYTAAEKCVQDFLAIRQSWDKCLAPAHAVMSSSIPVGWVLPTNPSSGAWEALLSSEAQD